MTTKPISHPRTGGHLPKHSHYTMVLPVCNEEDRIRRVVDYYRCFAPLIVIDNFSTDRTVEILNELGVRWAQYRNLGSTQTPECLRYFESLVSTGYILYLSASEFIPATLLHLFEKVATEGEYDAVSTVRESYTAGELLPLWGGGWGTPRPRVERFVRKGAVSLSEVRIHRSFKALRALSLPGDPRWTIVHLRDSDAASLIRKSVDYGTVEALQRRAAAEPLTLRGLAGLFLKEIVRFFHLPPSRWRRFAAREVWARLVMHSIAYFAGWELESGATLADSKRKSEQLWARLVQKDGC